MSSTESSSYEASQTCCNRYFTDAFKHSDLVMVVDVSLTSVVVAGLRRSVDLMQTDRRVTAAVGSLQV